MGITISEKAASWYKEELMLNDGDYVRFYVRYGGFSSFQKGFSLGISIETPKKAGIRTESLGIVFYIEEEDLWYLDNENVSIVFNEKLNEPEITRG